MFIFALEILDFTDFYSVINQEYVDFLQKMRQYFVDLWLKLQ